MKKILFALSVIFFLSIVLSEHSRGVYTDSIGWYHYRVKHLIDNVNKHPNPLKQKFAYWYNEIWKTKSNENEWHIYNPEKVQENKQGYRSWKLNSIDTLTYPNDGYYFIGSFAPIGREDVDIILSREVELIKSPHILDGFIGLLEDESTMTKFFVFCLLFCLIGYITVLKKIKINTDLMLNFKVQLSKGRAVYTKILKNGELEALSAQEMYTTMQQNKNVKHFKAPILFFGVLIFVFLGLSVILFEDAPSLFLFLNAYMFLAFFCYLGKAIFLRKRSKAQRTNVEYDIDSDGKKRMNAVKEAFDYVNRAVTVFPSAGLHSIIFLDTNIDIYGWTDPTDKDEIFFMPDVCLVNVKQAGLCAIEYNKMHSVLTDSINTTQYPPSDSEILGETWLHARTNGQPDKRYTNNPIVYSIKQGFTLISDNTNLTDNKETNFSAGLIISSLSIAKGFTSNMKKIFSDSNEAETKPKDANPKTKDANPGTKEVAEHSKVSNKSMLPLAKLFKAEKNIEALNSIFEKSHSLWIENLNKISKVNYIMFCEAPPFDVSGSVSNYIYDRNGEAKGMFLKAPYKALKGVVDKYPSKAEMIDYLNSKGFLFMDLLPLSIKFSPKRNTKKYEDFVKYFWNGNGTDLDFSELIVQSRLHEMKDKISDDLRVCFALKSISMVVNSLDNSNLILGDKTIHIHEDLVGLNTAGQPGVTEITNAFKSSVLK